MPTDALIFDLDGTLVDSAPDLRLHVNALLAEHDRPPLDLPTVTALVGHGVRPLVTRAFSATGAPLSSPALDAAVARYQALYAAHPVVATCPYPRVPEVLAALAARFPLGVCTNKPEALARTVLAETGLADFFQAVVGGDTLPVRKPDPAPLRAAAEALGARAPALVGDSEVDGETAAAAGVPFYWFTGGYHHQLPTRITARFDRWDELPAFL